jgi:hypothetical protein
MGSRVTRGLYTTMMSAAGRPAFSPLARVMPARLYVTDIAPGIDRSPFAHRRGRHRARARFSPTPLKNV